MVSLWNDVVMQQSSEAKGGAFRGAVLSRTMFTRSAFHCRHIRDSLSNGHGSFVSM